jgi:thiamine-monophosphate kinase
MAAEVDYPFTGNTITGNRIALLGETALLEKIRCWLGPVAPPPPQGMGDDCAVLEPIALGSATLLTTDSLTYGQHFDETTPPEAAGEKLVKRNLSDVAAMGGRPDHALLNLLSGPDLSQIWLERFVCGICRSCQRHGVTIIGGDISQTQPGFFSAALTLSGYTESKPLLRSTATLGDFIYVTGSLGGSILGKHIHFEPRMDEGRWLANHEACTAMMDLTDGLGKDLAALLPRECSAAVDLGRLPISEDARRCAREDGQSVEAHVFSDGEDYELLCTVSRETDLEAFEASWRARFPNLKLTRIGSIVEGDAAGRYIDSESGKGLPWQTGFEQFKKV